MASLALQVVTAALLFVISLSSYLDSPPERREHRAILVGSSGMLLVVFVGLLFVRLLGGL